MAPESADVKIQDIYAALVLDKDRNELIFNDLLKALEMGRSPLFLTERVGVDGQVILELKTAVSFCKAHRDQLMSYLRATDCPLGILVNFAGPRVQYQRVLNPGRSRDSAHSSDSSHSGDSSHS